MRLLVFLLVTSFAFTSCNQEKYKNRIQGSKGTFWDVSKRNGTVFNPPVNSYFFGINGDCSYFSLRKINDGNFERIPEFVEAKVSKRWKMQNNTLEMMGSHYLVHSPKAEMLILIPLDRQKDTLELKLSQ